MTGEASTKYALFWGCQIPFRLPWIEKAAREVLPRLNVEIVDLPFSCCPDPVAFRSTDENTWLALAARNLTLAEEQDLDILTLCSGCFETLRLARHMLKNPEEKEKINQILKPLGRKYQGVTDVFHIQQWLYEQVGLDRLSRLVTHPLKLRVATHTGCHYTRPADIMQTDNPVYPYQLDDICSILGMESVDYPDKNLCCGTGAGLTDRSVPAKLVRRKMDGMNRTKAQALIAHCPSCILSYDLGQIQHERRNPNTMASIPVLHLLEVLGLAMGMDRQQFAFEEHHVPVTIV